MFFMQLLCWESFICVNKISESNKLKAISKAKTLTFTEMVFITMFDMNMKFRFQLAVAVGFNKQNHRFYGRD